MNVRTYTDADLAALVEMHQRAGMQFEFPKLGSTAFVSTLVLENGHGVPEMALAARRTAEMFLLVDPRAGTAKERWEHFLALHREAEERLYHMGFDDVHAWLPPNRTMRRFGRRLESLGWVRDDKWVPYCKYLEGRS